MKKSMIIGMVSLLTISNVNALEVRPFIGGNLSVSGVTWTEESKNTMKDYEWELPVAFAGAGFEAGARFKTDHIYSAAITFAYDYLFNSKFSIDEISHQYIDKIEAGFSAVSITFDNYLRVSGNAKHQQNLVLGVGAAYATERGTITVTEYGEENGLSDSKFSDSVPAFVAKLGYNFQLVENTDLFVNGRVFIPDHNDDVDAMFNASVGLRFVF